MTDEERKARRRRYYAAHKAEINAYAREWYAKNSKRVKEQKKILYREMMSDPDRYARYTETSRRWKQQNKDRLNAKRREWRRTHRKRYLRQLRFERDRRNMRFRQSPELYAMYLAEKRKYNAAYRRRLRHGMRTYAPRMNRRTPFGCTFGRVLDTRSVFLWNNLPAASLVAGRAYRAMQWREAHCDRFGQVCR